MAHEHDNGMRHTQTQTHSSCPSTAMQHSLQLPLLVLLYTSVRRWFGLGLNGVQGAHSRHAIITQYLSWHSLSADVVRGQGHWPGAQCCGLLLPVPGDDTA